MHSGDVTGLCGLFEHQTEEDVDRGSYEEKKERACEQESVRPELAKALCTRPAPASQITNHSVFTEVTRTTCSAVHFFNFNFDSVPETSSCRTNPA